MVEEIVLSRKGPEGELTRRYLVLWKLSDGKGFEGGFWVGKIKKSPRLNAKKVVFVEWFVIWEQLKGDKPYLLFAMSHIAIWLNCHVKSRVSWVDACHFTILGESNPHPIMNQLTWCKHGGRSTQYCCSRGSKRAVRIFVTSPDHTVRSSLRNHDIELEAPPRRQGNWRLHHQMSNRNACITRKLRYFLRGNRGYRQFRAEANHLTNVSKWLYLV